MRNVQRGNTLIVRIARSSAARRLLAHPDFIAEWAQLCAACPWSTAFQAPPFMQTWLEAYQSQVEPIIALTRDRQGRLSGLLVLAKQKNGDLIVAGGAQAEYQAWISRPDIGDRFMAAAMTMLRQDLPRAGLTFRFLPPGAPTRWISSVEAIPALLKSYPRPLLRFGSGAEIAASLKKSSNRSKLNRMKRLGGFSFRQITNPAEFDLFFDRIIDFYDLRHGAIHGADHFAHDPINKPFHHAMMRSAGLLHATVMMAGDDIAAAHLGVLSQKELQLGIIVHNPMMARHSPGKLHILMLSQMLREQGLEQLDLTPGGDPYKERFANAWDQVHTLTVFATEAHRQPAAWLSQAKTQVKRLLHRMGSSASKAEMITDEAKQWIASPAGLARRGRNWLWSQRHTDVYASDGDAGLSTIIGVRRDHISDLLCYQPQADELPRRAFLSNALRRLEAGQHCYTVCDDGHLIACGWLAERIDADLRADLLTGMDTSHNAAVAHDIQVSVASKRGSCTKMLLAAMLRDLPGRRLYAVLPRLAPVNRRAIESIGFEACATISEQRRAGRRRISVGVEPVPPARLIPIDNPSASGPGASCRRTQCVNALNYPFKEATHV